MARSRDKQKQHKESASATYAALFFLLLGLVTLAPAFLEGEGGFLAFVGKCGIYLLGRCVFILPLSCFLLAWKLFWDGRLSLLRKETLGMILLVLTLVATAHQICLPAGEELTPHTLPEGGGLAGGLVTLLLHRYFGNIGTWLALALGWCFSLGALLPLSALGKWLGGFFSHGSDEDGTEQAPEGMHVAVGAGRNSIDIDNKNDINKNLINKNKSVPQPASKDAAGASEKNARKDAGSIGKLYRSGEFGSFTEGIKTKSSLSSSFRRILGGESSPYEEEAVKQELEEDPIQVPRWQDASHMAERERNVVLRPVVDYDAADTPAPMPEQRFLSGETPRTEAGAAEAAPAGASAAPENYSVIHNEYRLGKEAAQEQENINNDDDNNIEENAADASSRDEYAFEFAEDHPPVAIYDSADKAHAHAADNEEGRAGRDAAQAAAADAGHGTAAQEDASAAAAGNEYRLPPLELLDLPKASDPSRYQRDIMEQCSVLEQTLADFRVRAKVIAVTRGPSVTRFELEPAPGVKVSSVVNLADDIALRLAAPGVRIEAPIPGKSAIGIEAPNTKNDMVCFREVVEDAKVRESASRLLIGLGKDIGGKIITADLAKMPHLLVAGSTGSGKSVCINTIIAGILYKARPEEVKLILVDPKVVELSNYNGIPHLLTPVVTEPKKAASALHWAVAEMERRYKCFADNRVREINSYNAQAEEKMPFIVIIIDELSDLMMVAKVDVEDAILRLAQKARAAGIHLILATQRPSVDVITGIVKANIPSRIAFAVSSQTDSRTIIDMGGAEKLLGKGDMLFYPIGSNKPVRVQGAFVTDEELNRIVNFIVQQSIPVEYSEEVTEQELACDSKNKNNAGEEADADSPQEDELFQDALSLVLDMGQASSSMLQRRFRIGYTRAARLVDTMEELGIVGQSVGSKPREVIMSRQEAEERFGRRE